MTTTALSSQAAPTGFWATTFRTTVFPLFLLLCTPPLVIALWATIVHLDGSLVRMLSADGARTILARVAAPSLVACAIIFGFAAFELALMLLLPGAKFLGPITPAGNRPEYKLNGVAAFFVTHAAFYLCSVQLGWFSPAIVYDHLGEVLVTLCLFALGFCLFLYFKGAYFPSSSDAGKSGNPIFDYFWGTELHPRLFGVSLKQLCNCRFAMMGWGVMIVSYAFKEQQLYGAVSNGMIVAVGLQLVYIFKFFWWESGYFTSLDIMHDRFGYYICWGVLCWLPCVYTLSTMFLVTHPSAMSVPAAIALFLFGVLAIWVNYDADAQRQRVRASNGKAAVWGKAPVLIEAHYTTGDGKQHSNLLLASGWWGVARHFHYVPELTLAACWIAPVGFAHALPWFYLFFLTILLVDRAGRDDLRCAKKYGRDWETYKAQVRWRMVPFVY
jgi:7-dehydrocholesterol reductase